MPKDMAIMQARAKAAKACTKVTYRHETIDKDITFEPSVEDQKAYCKSLVGTARKPYEDFVIARHKERCRKRNAQKRAWLMEEKKRRNVAKNALVDLFDEEGNPDWSRIEEIKSLWKSAYGYDAPVESWENNEVLQEDETVPDTPSP